MRWCTRVTHHAVLASDRKHIPVQDLPGMNVLRRRGGGGSNAAAAAHAREVMDLVRQCLGQKDGRSRRATAFEVAVRLLGVLQGIFLIYRDLHCAARDHIEQIIRRL